MALWSNKTIQVPGLAPIYASSGPINAFTRRHYILNTASNAITVNLPVGVDGYTIRITDAQGTFATNNVTVVPSIGEKINNLATNESLILDANEMWIEFTWNANLGLWIINAPGILGLVTNNYTDYPHIVSPSSPELSTLRLYAKSNDALYTLDSSNIEKQILASSVPLLLPNALPLSTGQVLSTDIYGNVSWRILETDPVQIAGNVPPTLDLNFSGSLPSSVSFIRNSIGSYFDYDGTIRYASADEARIEYDPITQELKGLLIEEQRQNLVSRTEQFVGGSWAIGGTMIVVPNAEIAPDKSNTACKIIGGNGATNHYLYVSNISVSSIHIHTASIFLKSAEFYKVEVAFDDDSLGNVSVEVDLQTKTIINEGAGGSGMTAYPATIKDVGNGWVRVSITGSSTAGTSTRDFVIQAMDAFGNKNYIGDGKSGVYVWGPQFEVGQFPTSYIPSQQTFAGRSIFSNIAYASKSYASTEVGTGLTGLTFKPDGTKMYLSTTTNDAVYQYSLSTAWDVSTTTYDTKSFTETGPGIPYAIRFNNDGTKAFRIYDNDALSVVREYTLSTAYDISTMTYASVSYSLAADITEPYGLEFSTDGLFMYVANSTTDKIYRYTLGSAWSLSSVTASGELSVTSQDGNNSGITFDSTGKTLLMLGTSNDRIYIYILGTAWDITTAKYVNDFSVGTQDTVPFDLCLRPDNSTLYVAGGTNDDVFQYDCTLASNVSSYYNSTGTLIKSTDLALARNTYNPSLNRLHLPPKLLLEQQATNLCLQSEDFNTSWTKVRSTVTTNSITAPDGTTTADTLVEDASASVTHYLRQSSITVTNGLVYTISVFVKSKERSQIALGTYTSDGWAQSGTIVFDLRSKTVTNFVGSVIASGIQELKDDWHRVWISQTTASTSVLFDILLASGGTTSYTGDNASGIYLWGAQLEQGYAPSSYIPTTTAAVTRSADFYSSVAVTRQADLVSMAGNNFTSWYRFNEGTIYCDADTFDNQSAIINKNIPFITMFNNSQKGLSLCGIDIGIVGLLSRDSSLHFSSAFAYRTFPTTLKIAGAFNGTNTPLVVAIDGTISTGDTPLTLPPPVICYIGHRALHSSNTTGDYLNGHIRRLIFWPKRIENYKLEQMTKY